MRRFDAARGGMRPRPKKSPPPVAKLPGRITVRQMAEPKKKAVASGAALKSPPPGSQPAPGLKPVAAPPDLLLSREELDALSPLQLIDMITDKLPPRHMALMDMVYLRDRVAEMEEINEQARQAIEKLDAVVEKLRAPAYRVGTRTAAGHRR